MYSSDVRPGVPMVKRVKDALRKEAVQKEKNTQNRQKSFREQERESREAALQSSISTQNKGFALLQKMGYKEGQGLGKQGQWLGLLRGTFAFEKKKKNTQSVIVLCFYAAGAGRVEPVPLNIKTGWWVFLVLYCWWCK